MKLEKSNAAKTRRIILNSKNSVAVKEAIREISKEEMENNKELYRRLAYKWFHKKYVVIYLYEHVL